MTPEELRHEKANRWLAQAAKDLKVAELIRSEEPSRSVFFSQQAAEKSTKAFLTFHNVTFRRTHDLGELGLQCVGVDASLTSLMKEAADLSDYAVLFRYPDAPRELDEKEATEALDLTRRVYLRIQSVITVITAS